MDKIIEILKKCKYKGKYISALKKANLWEIIIAAVPDSSLSDVERVYLFLNSETQLTCVENNKKKFLGITRGYNKYCSTDICTSCKKLRVEANVKGIFEKYGVDNVGKLPQAINGRKQFWNDTDAVSKVQENRKKTCIEKYGVDNYFKRVDLIQQSMLAKHGVINPGLLPDHIEKMKLTNLSKYGIEWSSILPEVKERRKNTNIKRYGAESPMMNKTVSMKMIETKIKNGSFTKSNASLEATEYFREYLKVSGYDIDQVAYADIDYGLYEWGYYFDKWYLYDFVAFEKGHRGNPSKILEIIEYHGPFHYTKEDSDIRGNEKAVPWKSNNMTITESYIKDTFKEKFAKENLTNNYKIVWSEKYYNKGNNNDE